MHEYLAPVAHMRDDASQGSRVRVPYGGSHTFCFISSFTPVLAARVCVLAF